jgi:5-methylcytosine-specific restriction endonuclease McrA
MNEADRQRIRAKAAFRCEYCHFHERHLPFASFHLDHVVARQHGGSDEPENAAWSCQECNLLKGTNLSAVDPDTREIVPLFHPRRDGWEDHFVIEGNLIRGRTPTGRATVWLLRMNSPDRLELRTALRMAGEF